MSLIGAQQTPHAPCAELLESSATSANQRADISLWGSNWPDPATSGALHGESMESKPASTGHAHTAN